MKHHLIIPVLAALAAAPVTFLATASTAEAIVEGNEIGIDRAPWQVSLQDAQGHFCGGSILNATTIVTAAHCLENVSPADVMIVAGTSDLRDPDAQTVRAASSVAHPSYSSTDLGDVAVIHLSTPLELGTAVQPITPATADELARATTAVVSGWGATSESDDADHTRLQMASVPLVSDAVCTSSVGSDPFSEVCAGGTGTDSCYGDSGGPLVIETAGGPRLAGIVSWGEACGGSTPGVYTEVPAFADFLASAGFASGSPSTSPTDLPVPPPGNPPVVEHPSTPETPIAPTDWSGDSRPGAASTSDSDHPWFDEVGLDEDRENDAWYDVDGRNDDVDGWNDDVDGWEDDCAAQEDAGEAEPTWDHESQGID